MRPWLPALLLLAVFAQSSPFMHLEFFQYCSSLGYPVEDHVVPTDDHYNLRYFRLQAKNTRITQGKRVIYLQHGLVDSSDTWVVNEEHLAPAFVFANQGFDVWVGNSRGNFYSSKHMSPIPLQFWDFSFDQMGTYDLPAAFRYITRVTGKKIHYVGHSQGTLSMFIALSKKLKTVSDSLASFHAYGPVAYLTHQSSKAMKLLAKSGLSNILYKSHVKKLMQVGKDGRVANSAICKTTPEVCNQLVFAISDKNLTVNNMKRMPIIAAHFPSGSSAKNFVHFGQFTNKAEFRNYDYGQKKNLKIYGQKQPPFYDLSQITAPVHLYVGKYDRLADSEDASRLFKELTNSEGKTSKTYNYGHATFIWGKSNEHLADTLSVINSVEPTQMPKVI